MADKIPVLVTLDGDDHVERRTIRINRRPVSVPIVYARWGGWDIRSNDFRTARVYLEAKKH